MPLTKIELVTIFPGMFTGPLNESMIKRAMDQELVEIEVTDVYKRQCWNSAISMVWLA